MYPAARRIAKLIPGSKVSYTAPKPTLQSRLPGGATPKMPTKKVPQRETYKIPKTPKVSGGKWGH